MYQIKGNLFDPKSYHTHTGVYCNFIPCAICITTNGFVKIDNSCIMGRGVAQQAKNRWPGIDKLLGSAIIQGGNHPYILGTFALQDHSHVKVVSFPVKPVFEFCQNDKMNVVTHMRDQFKPGKFVPGWACVADINIIIESAITLQAVADEKKWQYIVLVRPGCGAGELDWATVEPHIAPYLDHCFYIITP